MWGGIIGLPLQDRLQIFKNFYELLSPGGTFVVDAPADTHKQWKKRCRRITKYIEEEIQLRFNFNLPTESEIAYYAHQSGFSTIEHIQYEVEINHEKSCRRLYLLKKKEK
jgi:cyclopropane fatty-acyl-phospholipid synthase-like methyltransferase